MQETLNLPTTYHKHTATNIASREKNKSQVQQSLVLVTKTAQNKNDSAPDYLFWGMSDWLI